MEPSRILALPSRMELMAREIDTSSVEITAMEMTAAGLH